jgi:hypothetical protein
LTTLEAFDRIIAACAELFKKKNQDYGPSWRVLRLSSIIDQILIKAARIRSIEEKGSQEIQDPVEEDYIGIVNYSIIGIIQNNLANQSNRDYSTQNLLAQYNAIAQSIRELLSKKNSDYGEIWREMRISSYTDLILMKLERLNQIVDNEGMVIVSEGTNAHLMDIVNYAIFALIRLNEKQKENEV